MILLQTQRPIINLQWLIIGFVVVSFSILFYFIHGGDHQSAVTGVSYCQAIPASPSRLIVPSLQVNAAIQNLGVTSNGEMDVPTSVLDVGWFKLGSKPGEKGSAVIAGHLNGKQGEPGVFSNLDKLKPGDTIFVEDIKGNSLAFKVRESRSYESGFAEEVFSPADGNYLNLVTCDGIWDSDKKSYGQRLVVFTDLLD